MVDFGKRVKAGGSKPLTLDPVALYDGLDRSSEKGPIRPAQKTVLQAWHEKRRGDQDLILKLHTGEGKTIVGLLMLQSLLHEGIGPALYLCPNIYLAKQTCLQASQFGVHVVALEPGAKEIPADFLESRKILVSHIQALFHGYTKFGLGAKSQSVGSLVVDDAHACIDSIRSAFSLRVPFDSECYRGLRQLFEDDLKGQGAGTYEDMVNGSYEAVLPVPYWSWKERQAEVVKVVAKHKDLDAIKFVWPLIKDSLEDCTCVFSGREVGIAPRTPPLHEFGSYARAKRRIYMSATVSNDAFLIKGLRLPAKVIRSPVIDEKARWSGEKMILIPSLLDDALDRSAMVHLFAPPAKKKRPFGVVALTPSFARFADWEKLGAHVAKKGSEVDRLLEQLRNGERDYAVVIANRYDGIDLPDNTCRILIMDSRPHSETPTDIYVERCVENADVLAAATARRIEQGLGRAVRGEKDYCVVVIIGPDLVASVRTKDARRFLSAQTQKQIEIGLNAVDFAKEDAKGSADTQKVFLDVLNQSLQRDEGWKEYYKSEMDGMVSPPADDSMLDLFEAERSAEDLLQRGDVDRARATFQRLADDAGSPLVKGWYTQEMARAEYKRSKLESNKLQVAAHNLNRRLLRPATGTTFTKVNLVTQRRLQNCHNWIRSHENYEQLSVAVEAFLSNLHFGVLSEPFEAAVDTLGKALGFATERPDQDWKEGPDNLWAVRDNTYVLIECKSMVEVTRAEIAKAETDQMNRASDWFTKNYGQTAAVTRLLVIATKKVGGAAALAYDTLIVREKGLNFLRKNVRAFFREFASVDFADIAEDRIQQLLEVHHLTAEQLASDYGEKPVNAAKPAKGA